MVGFSEKRIKVETMRLDRGEYRVVEDFWGLKIGYCSQCASELFIKESTAQDLFRWFKKKFA